MTILHLIDRFDYCDGCARHVYLLAREQKKRGDTVIVTAGEGDAVELLEEISVPTLLIPEILHAKRSVAGFVKGGFRLSAVVSKLQPSIIHAHHYYAAHQIRIFSPSYAKRLVMTVHANRSAVGKLPIATGERTIAVSEATRKYILRHLPKLQDRVRVVRNCSEVLEAKITREQEQQIDRLADERKRGQVIVAFFGRLVPAKGADILIEAVSQSSQRDRIILLFAGEGPEELALRAQAGAKSVRATFTGTLHSTAKAVKLADIVAIPSLHAEGLPMILMEAGTMGKAVVASATDGIPEILQNDSNGIVVEPGNAAALSRALERLVLHPGLRIDLGSRFQESIRSRYSLSSMVDGVSAVYREIVTHD